MIKHETQFWESTKYNNYSYQQYYLRLVELAVSMFKWENLPETVDPRFLELVLLAQGRALFFKDEDIGYLGLRFAMGGRFNVYHIPIERRAYAENGYNATRNIEDSVVIYNNLLHTNSMLDIELFAKRLYNIDRTIDINVNAQKTPILIQCDESQRLTMKNVYMKYEGNEPVIFGDKNLNPNSVKVLTTDAPFVSDKLYDLKIRIWNEALTYLGISSVNITKKERLVRDEVIRNLGGTVASRYSRLEARQTACDQINKMFGLNISCEYREDILMQDTEMMMEQLDEKEKEGKEDMRNE